MLWLEHFSLFKHTKCTSQIQTAAVSSSEFPRVAVPATNKWAAKRQGPRDHTWHPGPFYKSKQPRTRVTATADQSVTQPERSCTDRKRAVSNRKQRAFLWVCVCECVCQPEMQRGCVSWRISLHLNAFEVVVRRLQVPLTRMTLRSSQTTCGDWIGTMDRPNDPI